MAFHQEAVEKGSFLPPTSTHEEIKDYSNSYDDVDDEICGRRPCWANIPSDLRNLIFSYLFAFDCIRFRLTCKEWRFAIKVNPIIPRSIQLDDSMMSKSSGQFPWLMFSSKQSSQLGVFDFFHPISNETYTMHIPELANCRFRCSRYGWLLMSKGYYSLFFFNPFISKSSNSTISLPDLDWCNDFFSMSFTTPPNSSDCMVIAYEQICYTLSIYTWCHGNDYWSKYEINNLNLEFRPSCCTPSFYKELFLYQLDVNGRLLIFVPDKYGDEETADWEDLLKPTRRNVTYRNSYMAMYDLELVSVFVGHNGDPIEIFEMDWIEEEWVKVESLGNRTMFIGETGSLLVTAKTNGSTTENNKIYLPKFRNIQSGDNRKIPSDQGEHNVSVFYSLDTHKYHGSGTDFCSENWNGIDDLQDCVWSEQM